MGAWVSRPILFDNSAWARLASPGLSDLRAEQLAGWLEEGRVAVCLPFLLEVGYSARDLRDHEKLLVDLRSLPHMEITPAVEDLALNAQYELARSGHHRLPPVDLLIGAVAAHYDSAILHYDHDFDLIQERTSLAYESVWLAPAGSL